jgi:hypothetical protein
MMDVETRRAVERQNPQREIDWRWQRACRIVAERRNTSKKRDDPAIIAAVSFHRALDRCQTERDRESLRRRWPGLFEAHHLAQDDGPRLWEVQARLLANETDEVIAERSRISIEAVRWYERLFFQVRDRLRARDWIMVQAIGPRVLTGVDEHDLGPLWKAFGYFGGELVLEVVLAVSRDRELPAWVGELQGGNQSDFTTRLRLSCRLAIAAMMLPVGQVKQLLGLYLEVLPTRNERRTEPVAPDAMTVELARLLAETKAILTPTPKEATESSVVA